MKIPFRPANGHNALRWDCKTSGCFNLKRRPKIEVFCDCFPRRINFGDVDGLVELNGCFCLLEWKGDGGSIRRGQEMSYKQFTRANGNVVFVVDGDAETMIVRRYGVFWRGKWGGWLDANLEDVKSRLKAWAGYAQKVPRIV